LALSGHSCLHRTCPLSGVKRTCRFAMQMSAFDPKRTWVRRVQELQDGAARLVPDARRGMSALVREKTRLVACHSSNYLVTVCVQGFRKNQ